MSSKPSIFISYRREDSEDITGRIYDRLKDHFDSEIVFKDVYSIPYGDEYPIHIQNALDNCVVVIAVIGPTWLSILNKRLTKSQDWVRHEILTGLSRNIPVIPLLVNETSMPRESELPALLKPLARLNAAKAGVDPYFDYDMSYLLIPRLEEIVGDPELSQQAKDTNSKLPTLKQVKLATLGKHKEILIRKYQAAFAQYNSLLSAADKVTVEEQINVIEQDLYQVEQEINNLLLNGKKEDV